MDFELPDRRIFERMNISSPIRVRREDKNGQQKVQEGKLCDISAQGARLYFKEQPFLNESVSLEIDLPDGQGPLIVKGSIIWMEKTDADAHEAGFLFDAVRLMNMHRLLRFAH